MPNKIIFIIVVGFPNRALGIVVLQYGSTGSEQGWQGVYGKSGIGVLSVDMNGRVLERSGERRGERDYCKIEQWTIITSAMLVFIDDSGDPGFRMEKGSSKIFVIVLVFFDDPLEAEEASLAVKKLRRKQKVSDQYEFKFNKTNRVFREAFFESVKHCKFRVRAIVVDKQKIQSPRLRAYKEDFYNFVIMHVIKNSIGRIKKAKLKFDKRGERALRNELRVYLSRELDNKKNNVFTDVKFVDSRQNTLIQLADMVAGSIFASYTKKDTSYLNQLKEDKKIEDILEY